MLDLEETGTRLARVRDVMAALDLDLLLAVDLSRDEILRGHQRWLTGYIPIGGPAAALLGRDGPIELISDRIGKPVTEYYRSHAIPIEPVSGFSPRLVAERVLRRSPRRLGVMEPDALSITLAAALSSLDPALALVDVSTDIERLRLRKSVSELALIRRSCEIADSVWEHVPDILRVGRRNFEVIADVEHLMRLHGAESGFNLLLPLPFLGRQMQSLANTERIAADARYLLEVSPRYQGYYAQLTIPVTSRADDGRALRAYEDLVQAREATLPLMRPGADLSEIAVSVEGFLAERGHKMASRSLGHFCGMALEEPRHDPTKPFRLEEGMTLIFHPVLADAELHSLMRADTYVIDGAGAQRLTRYEGGMLTFA